MRHRPLRHQNQLVALLMLLVLAGCSSSASTVKDERVWFRTYVRTVVANLRPDADMPLQHPGAPYIGPCRGHSAEVTWQATFVTDHQLVGNAAQRNEVISNIFGRALLPAPANIVRIIDPGVGAPGLTDTAVLIPAPGTRVQMSVPDIHTILFAGDVGC